MTKDEKDGLEGEMKNLGELRELKKLPAAQKLIKDAKDNVVEAINKLAFYHEKMLESELHATCAILKAHIDFYEKLDGVEERMKTIEQVIATEGNH